MEVLTSWESVKEKCKLKILAAQYYLIRVLQYLSEGDRSVRGTPSLNAVCQAGVVPFCGIWCLNLTAHTCFIQLKAPGDRLTTTPILGPSGLGVAHRVAEHSL